MPKKVGIMKKQLVAAALLTVVSGSAMAADLSRPAPVYTKAPPMVPAFSWTGFYIGGNLGGAWEHGTLTDSLFGLSFSGNNNAVFIGGGQAGFNYQVSNVVFGVEGDFDWASNNNNNDNNVVLIPGVGAIQATGNDRWLTTVAGRLGYAWDRVLLYGKGGGAWVGNNGFTVTNVTTGGSITTGGSSTNSGWVAGAGLEWAFVNNWTARVEYNYIGLSSKSITVPALGLLPADTFTLGSHNIQTVTVGINYLFNWGGARY
jgi:outer membrane immunogenic protein